jgi:hypothetical protein
MNKSSISKEDQDAALALLREEQSKREMTMAESCRFFRELTDCGLGEAVHALNIPHIS